MSTCRIHNVRFYNLEPKAVTCLCYGQDVKKLALTRLVFKNFVLLILKKF